MGLVAVASALVWGCTPSPTTVRPVAEASLREASGERYTVTHVKSEFNEGNGDRGRVRIWAQSTSDPELRVVFSASYRDGRLDVPPERLRALHDSGRAGLAASRAFIRAAAPRFESFAVRTSRRSGGGFDVELRIFEEPCEIGEGCTLYARLAETLAAFEPRPVELSVYFFAPSTSDRPHGGVLMHGEPRPGERLPWRLAGSLYVLSSSLTEAAVAPGALRARLALHRSAVAYHNHWSRMRAALGERLDVERGQPMHLDAGGRPLELVPGSVARARYEGVACPEASLGTRVRCPEVARERVACVYDLERGTVALEPSGTVAP